MDKKTHVEILEPEISVRYLADYMAGSERKRRSVVEGCKYRPIARLLQHKEANIVVASAVLRGSIDPKTLKEKADFIRGKLSSDDFDALTNEANADFVNRFADVAASINLPTGEFLPGKNFPVPLMHGVKIKFSPNLLIRRVNPKTNAPKVGSLMLRYSKGKPLPPLVGDYQAAAMFGLFCDIKDDLEGVPDKSLCLILDVQSGILYPAPGASVSMFANMKAACATIAERWPNIPPPKGAVL